MKNLIICILFLAFSITNSMAQFAVGDTPGKLDTLLSELPKIKTDSLLMQYYHDISQEYLDIDNDKSTEFANKLLELAKKKNSQKWEGEAYYRLAYVQDVVGNFDKANDLYAKAIELYALMQNKEGLANVQNNLGILCYYQGNYQLSLDHYIKASKLYEELQDQEGLANIYSNIGLIYDTQNNYDKALEYYLKALNIRDEQNDKQGIADTYTNIGLVLKNKGKWDDALEYYKKSMQMYDSLKSETDIANTYTNIGEVLEKQNKIKEALEYQNKSLKIALMQDNKSMIAEINAKIGLCFIKLNDNSHAITYLQDAVNLSQELGILTLIKDAAYGLSIAYGKQKQYEKAYYYHVLYKQMSDSASNEDNVKKITQLGMQYEFDKKQREQELDQVKKEGEQRTKLERQKILTILFIVGFGLMVILAIVIFRSFLQKKKANNLLMTLNAEILQQKEEILTIAENLKEANDSINQQNEVLTFQKTEIEEKNHHITSSINYAKRIQTAVLSPDEVIHEAFPYHFILFKPRDIVSGDFYFFKKINAYITEQNRKEVFVFCAADCTGHGVPGAFMSMLGMSFLNEIVSQFGDTHSKPISSSEVLNELRKKIKLSLRQTGKDNEAKDGMDIAFVILDTDEMKGQYAGAYNSMLLVRQGELIEFKADRQPVGVHMKEKESFTNHSFDLLKKDTLYVFSDGYQDQVGGENKDKFLTKRFKQLLVNINDMGMQQQKEYLDQTILEWKGDSEQVDDVLVMGIRIS